jgi:hypothetical protein
VTYWIAFYWLCAGLASYRIDAMTGVRGLVSLVFSLLLGGVAIPVRILTKLAE